MKNKEKIFPSFLALIEEKFLNHPIVAFNHFTHWFAKGTINLEEVRHFTVQFSVFSNFFLVAQLKKMINAQSLESMRSAKEILANEIGVNFKNYSENHHSPMSVEGGTFRFGAAHFEWLLEFGRHLGLEFNELGKWKHGTPSTLFFCQQLDQYYGHEDPSVAAGASFAIENWANAGFWKELIKGLTHFKNREIPDLPLGFFIWHDRIEAQHAQNTQEELKHLFFQNDFDQEKFIVGGLHILEALAEFWNGLERDRLCAGEVRQKFFAGILG